MDMTGHFDAGPAAKRPEPGRTPACIEVVQFLRSREDAGFSLERMFADIRDAMPDDVAVRLVTNPYPNTSLVARVRSALNARRRRGPVNHVLGDTHYLANFLPRRTTLITVHDCISLERLRGTRRAIVWLFNYWWPLKHAAEVVVVSEFTRRNLHKWVRYPDDRMTTIPPPLSREFSYSPPRPHRVWSRLLHIGVSENKNLPRVAEALDGLDITLSIVGQPSVDQCAALDRHGIKFEIHQNLDRDGIAEQYRLADVLLFASTYEGFGMPIIEAQAVGRPVVTSEVASMPEAAGGAACLVDPFDSASIRAGVCRVLQDSAYAAELIRGGRNNVKRYDASRIAAQYAQIYRRLGGCGFKT